MTYVALAELGALVLTVIAFAGLLRAQQRAHARREDLLVNQLLHAVGKPWQPAPDAENQQEWRDKAERSREERRAYAQRFSASPEQLPV